MSPTKSTFLKVLAWFLAVATGLSAIVGIGANLYAMEADLYTGETSYYDTNWFQTTAHSYMYRVIDSYQFDYVSSSLANSNNIGYQLEDMEGNILTERPLIGEIGTTITREDWVYYKTTEITYETDAVDFETDTVPAEINGTTYETMDLDEPIPVLVTLYVAADMDMKDDFAASYMTYNLIVQNLNILPTLTIASILICLLSIIFSVIAVGHQREPMKSSPISKTTSPWICICVLRRLF